MSPLCTLVPPGSLPSQHGSHYLVTPCHLTTLSQEVLEGALNKLQWLKDYFELKTFENQQLKKRIFLNCLYLPDRKPSPKNSTAIDGVQVILPQI